MIQDMVRPLKQWLLRHRHNPYPTKAEKMELAIGSNMTLIQVMPNWSKITQISTQCASSYLTGVQLVRQRAPEAEERGTGSPLQLVQEAAHVQPIRAGQR